ncbi:hypothetical protein B0H10DRAFT_2254389, partial [Mycena sp. CBHHK59/15]
MANPQPQVPVPQLPQLPVNYPRRFDPQAQLPARIQLRIDRWLNDPPESQFQAYGPVDGYFHAKFPSTFFLIKPQAYLSAVSDLPQGMLLLGWRRPDHNVTPAGVGVTDNRTYPDFTICQFFGADADGTAADMIRVVYEIGSTSADKRRIYRQLEGYLHSITPMRFDGWLLGVAQIQNEVFLMKNTTLNTADFTPLFPTGWISLFDQRFVDELNQIRDLSYTRDATLLLRT